MKAYTVELGEPGRRTKYYIGEDLRVHQTAHTCKALSLSQARLARQLFLDGAKRQGRKITAKVVELARDGD